jgi:hypothetical protein
LPLHSANLPAAQGQRPTCQENHGGALIRKSSIDVLRNQLTRLYDRILEDSAGRRGSLFRLLK